MKVNIYTQKLKKFNKNFLQKSTIIQKNSVSLYQKENKYEKIKKK